MRYRQVQADMHGHVAELLAKSTKQGALDKAVTKEDREMLMIALQQLGRAQLQLRICQGSGSPPTGEASTWILAAG